LTCLAAKAGIAIQESDRELDPEEKRVLDIERARKEAVGIYHNQIKKRYGQPGLEYLKQRGIPEELIDRFKIGYAPKTPSFLLKRLSAKYSEEILMAAGLIYRDEKNQTLRDSFYCRVIIPSFVDDRVVNIYGRAIEKDPKLPHKNSRGHVGGFWNFNGARRFDELIVTEGVIDGLSLVALGYENVVATHGVGGFKRDHVDLLRRTNARRIYLCYDDDEAGREGMLRRAESLLEAGYEVRIVRLPQGLDPNDFARHGGTKAEFDELLRNSVTPEQFRVITALAKVPTHASVAERLEAVRKLRPLIRQLDPAAAEILADEVAERLGISREAALGRWAPQKLVESNETSFRFFLVVKSRTAFHALKALGMENVLIRPDAMDDLVSLPIKRFMLLVGPGEYDEDEALRDQEILTGHGCQCRIARVRHPARNWFHADVGKML